MPRIQGYERQVSATAEIPGRRYPTSRPDDFGGGAGRELGHGVQSAGQDLAFAHRQMQAAHTQRVLTDVHSALSMFRTEFFKQAEEVKRTAEPNDTRVGERWLLGESGEGDPGSVKHLLDGYRSKIEDPAGQHAFDRGAADIIEHFSNDFVRFQSKLAGQHAAQSYKLMVDNAKNDAERHPEATQLILRNLRAAIEDHEGPYARLPTDTRRTLLEDAERDTHEFMWRGRIRQHPKDAMERLQKGEGDAFLVPEKKVQLINAAESEIHSQQVEARRLASEAKTQLIELQHRTDQTLMAKFAAHTADPANPQFPALSATDIANELRAGRLEGPVGRAMLNMIDSHAKEATLKSDNQAYWDLFGRIALPWGHPDKLTSTADIYNAAAARKLTPSNVKNLLKDFYDSRSEDGQRIINDRNIALSTFKSSITHSNQLLGRMDQEGDINFGKFHKFMIEEEARAIKENRDPHDIYNEHSKHYVGNALPKYRKSLRQSMETVTKSLKEGMQERPPDSPSAPSKQRLPGETPQQYLERMKK
jgi:hypothetical protein